MYTLNWQPPYDWQWMFGFLGARAVTGVETVTDTTSAVSPVKAIRACFASRRIPIPAR
jgi:hypothetical protein